MLTRFLRNLNAHNPMASSNTSTNTYKNRHQGHFLPCLALLFLLRVNCLLAVPIVQEFYLPYPENQVYNSLKTIFVSKTLCGWPTTVPNVSPLAMNCKT